MIGGAKGIGIGIDFGIPNQYCRATSKPYIEKDVLDSLRVVASAYGKSNDDADRSIVKNLVDASNPFIISNAAFKLNSGFGKYGMDFLEWKANSGMNFTSTKLTSTKPNLPGGWLTFRNVSGLISETKVKVSGAPKEFVFIGNNNGADDKFSVTINNGVYTIPEFTLSSASGFYINNNSGDWSNLVIEQIPSFEGAFVTDGVNDLITSTKTVQEMLGGSNEITVVSMIHQIDGNVNYTNGYTNYIRHGGGFIRNSVSGINGKGFNKTGIYGYTSTQLNSSNMGLGNVINNILGDKDDYSFERSSTYTLDDAKYSVQNFVNANNQPSKEGSSIAWYWTIIANKVLTTDQINQVIAYFNLDRTLKPDILCDVKKQGITNDNHAEFGDKLIDFSGNGRDIQLNNIAWKGDSGIGKYEVDFSTWITGSSIDVVNKTSELFHITNNTDAKRAALSYNLTPGNSDIKEYKIKVEIIKGTGGEYKYYNEEGKIKYFTLNESKIYTLPTSHNSILTTAEFNAFIINPNSSYKVIQIPSHAGALCLDGVDDFGQYVGDLGLKDYTIAVDRAYVEAKGSQVPIISNVVDGSVNTPFLMEHLGLNKILAPHSFGKYTRLAEFNINRFISYQSTYKYNGSDIIKGTSTNAGSGLTIGRIGGVASQYANIALWSLLLFPYTLSEFLLERQLKRYKLGTLYPNMVEFRPVIKANANYNIFYTALLPLTGNIWERINIGDYVPVGRRIAIQMSFDNETSELVSAISSQLGNISITKNSNNKGYTIFGDILKNKSPQKINITIDEYIRYEDIVQPYPVLLRFNDENGNEVSWGGKFRIGSTITRIGYAADSNLLPNIYNIFGLLLNDNQVTSSKVIVEKTMVFKAKSAYIFDNNEPNCILSPRLLRIPNSSYKILGYIPDISGHGNHGVIHNSAYEGMSGANGYPYDYENFLVDKVLAQIDDDRKVTYFAVKNLVGFFNANSASYKGRIKLTGVKKAIDDKFIDVFRIYTNSPTNNESIDIYEDGEYDVDIKGADDATRLYFFALTTSASSSTLNTPIVIEQIGEYEGAYCLDGVDDFVTIPTATGGKQVFMKVNSRKSDCYLYDQRNNWTQYLGIVSTKDFIAYNYSNQRGKTYIDGILNENITANDLIGITHNITVTNNRNDVKQYSPCIGTSFARNSYAQMVLYDFMLFDNISTDDKIKELNEYVGIEAKVELPPYYWDAYGKTNLDADKATIQQRGVAIGDYDLINNNFAYEGMSGYNGYPAVFGTNKTYANLVPNDGNFILTSSHNIINVTKFDTSYGLLYSHIKLDGKLTSRNIDYPSYKIKVTGLGENFGLHYSYLESSSDTTVKGFEINNDGTYIIPKSFASDGSLTSNSDWIGFVFTGTAPESCNVTIEVLPEYENGLVYDGVTDYSENTNIPALTDYTYILKRQILKGIANSAVMYKGNITVNQGGAFICNYCEPSDTNLFTDFSFGGLSRSNDIDKPIIYGTKTSVNGDSITPGENIDTVGINVGKWVNYLPMVFYKLILYPKTIPLLQINFLKNLMERDEIIDLNNKIFIQE